MKILVITFDLGLTSSGISTDRVAERLAQNGHDVLVIAAMVKKKKRAFEVLRVSPAPLKPARLYSIFGNFLGRDLNYIFWERRASRIGLRLLQSSSVDVIYARGSPACSFSVGQHLSKITGIPLAIHFADPIPATPDWQPRASVREKMTKTVRPSLEDSALITFVNQRMLDYQEETSGEKLGSKSIIVPNPIPPSAAYGKPKNTEYVFTFLGSFFGSRKPDSLLHAFSSVAALHTNVSLHIYGSWTDEMLQIINANNYLRDRVKVFGWTSDIESVFKESSCLVDIDANVDKAVYTSNKLMEYLSVDRPILLISPHKSASRELVGALKNTCFVSSHDHDQIVSSMLAAIEKGWQEEDFIERDGIRSEMSLATICTHLEMRMGLLRKDVMDNN